MAREPRRCALSAEPEALSPASSSPAESSARPLKDAVLAALAELKGIDVACLDVTHLTDFSDYIVVATGTSNRHVRSLVDSVVDQVRALDVRPIGVEGGDTGEWMLVDLGSVVVNVMVPSMRAYYDLERLWTTPGRGERTLQP